MNLIKVDILYVGRSIKIMSILCWGGRINHTITVLRMYIKMYATIMFMTSVLCALFKAGQIFEKKNNNNGKHTQSYTIIWISYWLRHFSAADFASCPTLHWSQPSQDPLQPSRHLTLILNKLFNVLLIYIYILHACSMFIILEPARKYVFILLFVPAYTAFWYIYKS